MLPLLANTVRTNTKEKIKLHSFLSYYISFAKNKTAVGFFWLLHILSVFKKLLNDSYFFKTFQFL